jgi:tetratricopeptide (TPR) repeat protein
MNDKRIEQLLNFYKEDPNDPFIIYALATEYKSFDKEKALEYFENLLHNHERYVATYYHVCKLYEEMGKRDLAQQYYVKGVQICRQEGNMHAFSELQQAYNRFQGLDYEDEV